VAAAAELTSWCEAAGATLQAALFLPFTFAM
jgi:hypothetical protein